MKEFSKPKAGSAFLFTIFCFSLLAGWFFHKDSEEFIHPDELWGDRAGYYIYLPATFYYQWNSWAMPADLDVRTGGGFSLDTATNKISTKYTYGVALMQIPFFITANLVDRLAGIDPEHGFSRMHQWMMLVAAVSYLTAGLWFLYRLLVRSFPKGISIITLVLVFFGTNLFYYSIIDGMMSHVYSFFLFAWFMFSLDRFHRDGRLRDWIFLTLAIALVVLIRPANIVLAIFIPFRSAGEQGAFLFIQRWRSIILLPAILVAGMLLVWGPQMIYWKYLTGNWIYFSYQGEGFINLAHPRIAEVLFSPLNGLLTWTPLVLFVLAGLAVMFVQRHPNRWPILVSFAWILMVCASWKMWYFGCSYGQRSFVEYYVLLAVPLAWFLKSLLDLQSKFIRVAAWFLILLSLYANLRFIFVVYRHDRCWFGSTWDWDHYRRMVGKAGIIHTSDRINSFENDFENLAILPVVRPSQLYARSGLYSIPTGSGGGNTLLYGARMGDFFVSRPKVARVNARCFIPGKIEETSTLILEFHSNGRRVFADSTKLPFFPEPFTWTRITGNFIIPDIPDPDLEMQLVYSKPGRQQVFIDDLRIRFDYSWFPQ